MPFTRVLNQPLRLEVLLLPKMLMGKRINIYRKNIFLTENNITENETAPMIFYERITGTEKNKELKGATLLVDLGIAAELKIKEEVRNELEAIRKGSGINIYDLGDQKFF